MKERRLTDGELVMPFHLQTFGDKPATGRRLFISMHGGGGAPARVNDRQWENQKRLYQPGRRRVRRAASADEQLEPVARAAHRPALRPVDRKPDRVRGRRSQPRVHPGLLGGRRRRLSARAADGRPLGRRGHDGRPSQRRAARSDCGTSASRSTSAGGTERTSGTKSPAEWEKKLAELHKADPDGYAHLVKIYPDKPHWLDREDAAALPWMAKFVRNPVPKKLIWKQDDVTHRRFYWLAVDADQEKKGTEIVASYSGQQVDLQSADVSKLRVRLDDRMLDLDKPVTIMAGGKQVFQGTVPRTIATIAQTLAERGDPAGIFCSEVEVTLSTVADGK